MDDEARLGHLNLLEFARENARWARNHAVVDEGGALMFAGDTDWPAFNNGVLRWDDRADAAAMLDRARDFFHARGRGFSVWARELDADADLGPAAEAAGAMKVFDYPQMIRRERFEELPTPDGVEIRRVTDAAGVADFAEINAQAYTIYGSPAEATASNFGRPDAFLAPHNAAFVADLDGKPAGAAMAMLTHGIAGIFWVGTVEAARGKGIAEACMRVVTNWGFDAGAPNVQLQASPMGEPIYRRMGYEDLYRYDFWLCPGPEG
ncbi:MAG: GNAT family N-acetyltransferase [Actinomycetota bacterium]